MKGVATLCLGLILGGLGLWVIQSFSSSATSDRPRDQVATPELVASPTEVASKESLDAPAAPGLTAVDEGPAAADYVPPMRPIPSQDATARSTFAPGIPETVDAVVQPATQPLGDKLRGERDLAVATFDAGERGVGERLLREVYTVYKSRGDLDLTPEVSRLLDVEDDFSSRLEYTGYLAERSPGPEVFERQIGRARRLLATQSSDLEHLVSVWNELSLAYEVASNRAQRLMALTDLEPFVDKHILSGRKSPLLHSHLVRSGEHLSGIAKKVRVPIDSLRRLNALRSDTIRVDQVLRYLPGAVRVHIDKSDYRLWLTVNDRFLLEKPVGLGKEGRTPTGEFSVDVKEKDPKWWRPGEAPIPAGDPRNILGTRWLGFAASDGLGIHGTDDPNSIGQQMSAGCVRLKNPDIELVFDFVPYRCQVVIRD